jgi:hypothetical protein
MAPLSLDYPAYGQQKNAIEFFAILHISFGTKMNGEKL